MHGVHDVAIKVFCAPSSQRDVQLLHTEIAILRSCNNKNIVQFRGVCFRQPDVWLVMERLEKGSLFDLLARKSQKYTWYHRYSSAPHARTSARLLALIGFLRPLSLVSERKNERWPPMDSLAAL